MYLQIGVSGKNQVAIGVPHFKIDPDLLTHRLKFKIDLIYLRIWFWSWEQQAGTKTMISERIGAVWLKVSQTVWWVFTPLASIQIIQDGLGTSFSLAQMFWGLIHHESLVVHACNFLAFKSHILIIIQGFTFNLKSQAWILEITHLLFLVLTPKNSLSFQ